MLVRAVLLVALFTLSAGRAAALPPGVGSLAWSDEFNGSSLDPAKWHHRAAAFFPAPFPRHDGYLIEDAVSVGGGALTMKTYTDPATGQHRTGMISTAAFQRPTLFEQTYGYFEVRARFHTTSGMWSAFWLQSETIADPIGDPEAAGVEMDIFEHRIFDRANPVNVSNRINNALIWDGYGPEQQLRLQLSSPLTGLSNDSWHKWGLSWRPDGYTFYYDDAPIWNGADAPISGAMQYIILSSEVWGQFAGAIPAGGYGSLAATTTDMQVDYVRVYALPQSTEWSLADWEAGFGTATGAGVEDGDFDADGDVDGADFLAWQRRLGSVNPPAGTTVPEPEMAALLVGAAILLCVARRTATDDSRRGTTTSPAPVESETRFEGRQSYNKVIGYLYEWHLNFRKLLRCMSFVFVSRSHEQGVRFGSSFEASRLEAIRSIADAVGGDAFKQRLAARLDRHDAA